MSLIVIYYCLKLKKISYDNGRVSVRIFYKNNLICFRFQYFGYFGYFGYSHAYSFQSSQGAPLQGELRFIKLIRKKIPGKGSLGGRKKGLV